MKRLEVITFRASYGEVNSVENEIRKLLKELNFNINLFEIKLYKNIKIDTDFSIHIYYKSDKIDFLIEDLRNEMISNLKNFGLVNHSIWIRKLILAKYN